MNLPARVRLTIALMLTAILLPVHEKAYAVDLTALGPVLVLLVQEIVIGAVLGLTARLAISALQVAGSVVAQQLGLGFVTAVDPTQNQQGVLVGNFLTLLGITLIFATDLHHLVIAAMNDSYTHLPAGRNAAGRRRGAARHAASSRPRSASAFSYRRRFWCSDCCSISGLACCRG